MRLKLILFLMILYDFSLHLVELLTLENYHPLYPIFPNREVYTIFWTIYWGIGLIILLMGEKYGEKRKRTGFESDSRRYEESEPKTKETSETQAT